MNQHIGLNLDTTIDRLIDLSVDLEFEKPEDIGYFIQECVGKDDLQMTLKSAFQYLIRLRTMEQAEREIEAKARRTA